MAEQLKPNEDDELLTPAGFEGNPSLYGEQQHVHNYTQMTDAALAEKAQRFIGILNEPTTLPHHKREYARLIDHIAFEFACRDAERAHTFGHRTLESLGIEEPQL